MVLHVDKFFRFGDIFVFVRLVFFFRVGRLCEIRYNLEKLTDAFVRRRLGAFQSRLVKIFDHSRLAAERRQPFIVGKPYFGEKLRVAIGIRRYGIDFKLVVSARYERRLFAVFHIQSRTSG